MGVIIIVGGQYGSEGKGKVSKWYADNKKVDIAVRVGGRNSGHTVMNENKPLILKVLPSACLNKNIEAVIPSGSYFSIKELLVEKEIIKMEDSMLSIDPYAVIINDDFINDEYVGGLMESISSTGSGTGAALMNRIKRSNTLKFAKDYKELHPYIKDTKKYLRENLYNNKNILIEGTQGYGLSILHSKTYPYVTARDTTAAGFLSETGLSPLDVTEVVMVIRSFPIRVAGTSGPLKDEITWDEVARIAGTNKDLTEYTSVTKKVRRVGKFDAQLVRDAIISNAPTTLIMNHLDYLDYNNDGKITEKMIEFIKKAELDIGRKIDYAGIDSNKIIKL